MPTEAPDHDPLAPDAVLLTDRVALGDRRGDGLGPGDGNHVRPLRRDGCDLRS